MSRSAGRVTEHPEGDPREGRGVPLPVAAEGWPFIGGAFVLAALLALASAAVPAAIWPAILLGLFGVFSIYFFRDPERAIPADPTAIVSPADGRVVKVSREGEMTRIAIFLNVFDVHVNRAPFDGAILSRTHTPGAFVAASRDDAGQVNERNELVVATDRGEMRVAQIAGLVARRIVCRKSEGDRLRRGERFGLIRFGSRTELLLPATAQPAVVVGQRVRGGETVIARFDVAGDEEAL